MAKTLSTSGINSGQLIRTTQLTQVVDALTGNDDYDISISGSLIITGSTNISGSLTAISMSGDGSGLTGVTGEWDGSHVGNASITGSLSITGDISSSSNVYGVTGSFSHVLGASPLTIESDNFNVDSLGNISGSSISASGTISMLTASIGGGIFTSASLTSSPLQVNDFAESVVVTGVKQINFPNSTVFEDAPGNVSITFISSSYALTASHALNAGSDPFPFTGDAVITGSLIVSGSTLGGGSEIFASVLSLNDGTFGASGTSRGIKINSKAFAWGAPNSKLANVSIGSSAGNSLDQGGKNVLIGNEAGYYLVGGYWNVYIGAEAGNSNLSYEGNILIGNESGYYGGTSNQNNVAIGNTAMKGSSLSTNSSSFNVALGYYAGTQIHNGNNNTILGYKSGEDITSGSGNVIIGNYAAKGSSNMNNQLIIGSASLATISASLTTGDIIFPGSASFTGLPTSEPTSTGSLWISGSSPNHPNSGFLMIYNP